MRRLLFAFSVVAVLCSAACNGGGSTIQPPPPTGKYSVSSLNGTYAFTTSGEVCAGNACTPTPLARTGSFTADGMGHITGGIEDVNTAGTPGSPSSVTGGSYTMNADGRGTLALTFQSGNSINFGIVLTSTADGLMIDETSNSAQASTGSGNFILQQSTPFALSELSGNYVFDFTGFDGVQPTPNPESFIGNFTADGTAGTIPAGLFDDNDGGQLISGGMNPGTISQDPLQPGAFTNFGRGIATVAGQNFVFYIVNPGRIRFLSTNNGMLSGDAVSQSAPPPSFNGSFAFLVGGSSPNGGLTRVARVTASGTTLSKMLMDVNDASTEVQFNNLSNGSVSSYDATTGRGQFSFQDSNSQVYSFVFYLSSQNAGVIQDVSPSGTANQARVVADGSIDLQSGSPFTGSNISGTYAMNWSGLVTAGGSISITDEEDLLGQVKITSLSLSGTSDYFQFTGLTLHTDVGTSGSINLNGGDGTNGDMHRVNMDVNLSGVTPIHMVVYIVNPQLAFFANRDNSGTPRIVVGVLQAQQ